MIGIFDSGFGGLGILREILRALPECDMLYLGDNARSPYGNRSPEAIYQYTREACEWLFGQGCEIVVLACNTASARALRRLQREYLPNARPERRILGVLIPMAEAVSLAVKSGDAVGVIATRATVESGAYARELKKYLPEGVAVFQQSCPLFVPLVEEGLLDHPVTRAIAREYLEAFRTKNINALILGCTHYLFLKDIIAEIVGKECRIPDPARIVAASLKEYLGRHPEIDARISRNGRLRAATTDSPGRLASFAAMAGVLLPAEPEKVSLS